MSSLTRRPVDEYDLPKMNANVAKVVAWCFLSSFRYLRRLIVPTHRPRDVDWAHCLFIGGRLNSRAQELERGANQLVYGLVVRIASPPKLLVCSESAHIALSVL